MAEPQLVVVALGGNAILRRGDDGSITRQFTRADDVMRHVARLAEDGRHVILTHGNGPIVGNIVLRNEAARSSIPPMPLYIADADSEGGLGLLLQMSLHNRLREAGLKRSVVTVITQCIVDRADPAFSNPTKPIGPYWTPVHAAELARTEGWVFAENADGSRRRVVASPRPLRIVEAHSIGRIAAAGDIVIAAGGGGVPVLEDEDGMLTGVDAVIDKDWASALLACETDALALIILMEAEQVFLGWGTAAARPLDRLTVAEADRLLSSGELERGSIGPKVAACAEFARETGRDAIICGCGVLEDALAGRAGTRIVP
ncbi:MAG: carbamate kinase [Actinobacteria bacterium HGW-Actinobacteria-6]|nr:MAG: carbamate kinase [Actinobacteria bacterium HGW-Actinobacteria-6]